MDVLKQGSTGSQVALMQLALGRAGFPTQTDGIFGAATRGALKAFQRSAGLSPDGVAGGATHRALYPYYTGYALHTVRTGDTLYNIAARHGATLRRVETANPGLDALELRPGMKIVVPLPFPVVPTSIAWSSELVRFAARGLSARYPFITESEYGKSVMGRPLKLLSLGGGERRLLYTSAFHANEWITIPVLFKFVEELAQAYIDGGSIYTVPAAEVISSCRISVAPCVNPDGVDLVTGALSTGPQYDRARRIGADFPSIPFPSGWKANISGTDLNLQFPAQWESAREIKFAQGYDRPAPRDYVGPLPLFAPEARAVYELTGRLDPELILAYHTQGNVIYWRFLDFEPPGSRRLGECFAAASGYALEDTPYGSGFAGWKDWFIQDYDRPGYTIECGQGESPLPLTQFPEIYRANLGILTLAAVGC